MPGPALNPLHFKLIKLILGLNWIPTTTPSVLTMEEFFSSCCPWCDQGPHGLVIHLYPIEIHVPDHLYSAAQPHLVHSQIISLLATDPFEKPKKAWVVSARPASVPRSESLVPLLDTWTTLKYLSPTWSVFLYSLHARCGISHLLNVLMEDLQCVRCVLGVHHVPLADKQTNRGTEESRSLEALASRVLEPTGCSCKMLPENTNKRAFSCS